MKQEKEGENNYESIYEDFNSAFLHEAIMEKQVGEVNRYNEVLKIVTSGRVFEHNFEDCIESFRSCVSFLNREHEILVGAVLKVDWVSKKPQVVEAYINFLTELVSAQTFYLRGCLKMLLQKFLPTVNLTNNLDEMKLSDFDYEMDNVHRAIFALVSIVPTAPRHLLNKLGDLFPYTGKHQVFLQFYITNLFRITQYMPTVQENVLEIVIDNLLKLDCQICQQEIEEEEDDDSDDEDYDETQFDVEIEGDIKSHKKEQKEKDEEMKNSTARKLDNLMLTFFDHIHQTCFSGEIIDWGKTEALFSDLLHAFEMVLLPTHASAYVQFIIFYVCSFDQVLRFYSLQLCPWCSAHLHSVSYS